MDNELRLPAAKNSINYLHVTQSIIKSFSDCDSKQDFLDKVVRLIQEESSCEFVGIRVLDEDGHIPYKSYVGFSREFWESENMIQLSKEDCSCTRIISENYCPLICRLLILLVLYFATTLYYLVKLYR